MVDVLECSLCGDVGFVSFETVRFKGDQFSYKLCLNCGLVFQSPRMSVSELAKYYAQDYRLTYQGSTGPTEKDLRVQTERSRHLLEIARRHIPAVTRHLDIGSSAGALLQAFREHFGSAPVGVEPSEAYRSYTERAGLPVYPDLAALRAAGEKAFDLITMSHVLEHLPDPVAYLIDLRGRELAPDGWLLIEVPNLYAHDSFETAHLTAFSRHTLRNVLSMAGFRIASMKIHGQPRSPVIPLFITILCRPAPKAGGYRPERFVKPRRSLGMFSRRLVLRLFPGWAWRDFPNQKEIRIR